MDEVLLTQFLTRIGVIEERSNLTQEQILFMIVRGVLDLSPTINSRAILLIRSILVSKNELSNLLINEAEKLSAVETNPLTQNTLFNFLLAKCEDERVNSRKAAILALEALFIYLNDMKYLNLFIEKIKLRCRDFSLTIRKQAAETLTRVLQTFLTNEIIQKAWLRSVMTLIIDRESTVQQYVAKLIMEILVTPVAANIGCDVWKLLNVIEPELELRRLLLRVLVFLNQEKLLSPRFVSNIEKSVFNSEHSNAAWMLLAELSTFTSVDPKDAVQFWNKIKNFDDENNRSIQYVSKIIANGSHLLTDEQKRSLKQKISNLLYYYKLNLVHIPVVYYTFAKISDAIGENANGSFVLEKFNEEWFNNCLKELDLIVYEDPQVQPIILGADENKNPDTEKNNENEQNLIQENIQKCSLNKENDKKISSSPNQELQILPEKKINNWEENCKKLEKIIFSIGECLQYTPKFMNRSLFGILKVLVASDKLQELNPSTGPTPRPFTPDNNFNRPYTPIESKVNDEVQQASQGLPLSQTNETGRQSTMVVLMLKGKIVKTEYLTRHVRSQAVLTLGKLCLLDDRLAKKCVPVFVRELKENSDFIVRNNIVVVVCDLCIRYTLLVDRYSAILASCLNDSSVLVRQQTLMLLTNLIKEQFLKWEGSIDILLPQFPMMFFNHFLECLFYFNHVKHQSWTVTNEVDNTYINSKNQLAGTQKFAKRMQLYKFMMKTFTDDQKYKICERIACEVFAAINDNDGDDCLGNKQNDDNSLRYSNPNVVNLLNDTFQIMLTQEIKLSLQVGQRHVDDQADEDDPSEERTKAAKKLIAKVFGDKIVDAIVPQLLQLREFLIEKRSPLIHDCFAVILELHKDYSNNFDDLFAFDPLIKAEIEFHLKQARRKERENKNSQEQIDDLDNAEEIVVNKDQNLNVINNTNTNFKEIEENQEAQKNEIENLANILADGHLEENTIANIDEAEKEEKSLKRKKNEKCTSLEKEFNQENDLMEVENVQNKKPKKTA